MIKASVLAAEVRKLAAEQPGRQESCRYFNRDGQPCCIVGAGLARLGVDAQPFLKDSDLNSGTGVEQFPQLGIVEVDINSEFNFLRLAQSYQDSGWEWGYAVERAEAGGGVAHP